MKRILFGLGLLLITSVSANAQTTTNVEWDHIGATPAQVMSYNPVVKVDGVTQTATPTCVANGANTTCRQNVGTLSNGSHTFNISTTVDGVLREAVLTKTFPLTSTQPGTQPTSPRFTITIVITTP